MPEFLELLPPEDALNRLLAHLSQEPLSAEAIAVVDASGRVTAEPVISPEALPAFDRSTVDGYAVHAGDTYGAGETLPAYLALVGEVSMGRPPAFSLGAGQTALIHTGGMLPAGADAVVMLELTQSSRPGEIEVLKAVARGENTLARGEDITAGQIALAAGVRLRPADIGALLALGITQVAVVRRPWIGILSSGDEVIPINLTPAPGQVRDINSHTLGAMISQGGGIPVLFGIIPDQESMLRTRLEEALQTTDMAIVTAGSSASIRDLTARVIQQIGAPGVLVHGVNIKPGKPTILAVCNGKPVIGLPGNPVSALVIARLFVLPLIEQLQGLSPQKYHPVIQAKLNINLSSQAGREDWVPVRLVSSSQGVQAEPIFFKSNLIFSLSRADGLIRIPADANGLDAGSAVDVELL